MNSKSPESLEEGGEVSRGKGEEKLRSRGRRGEKSSTPVNGLSITTRFCNSRSRWPWENERKPTEAIFFELRESEEEKEGEARSRRRRLESLLKRENVGQRRRGGKREVVREEEREVATARQERQTEEKEMKSTREQRHVRIAWRGPSGRSDQFPTDDLSPLRRRRRRLAVDGLVMVRAAPVDTTRKFANCVDRFEIVLLLIGNGAGPRRIHNPKSKAIFKPDKKPVITVGLGPAIVGLYGKQVAPTLLDQIQSD